MRILLVEDNDNKRADIQTFLQQQYTSVFIDLARSYQSALRSLLAGPYDVVLLDMTLPTFDKGDSGAAGRLRALGGMELLDQITRRGIRARVVVLTAYDILGEGKTAVPLESVVTDIKSKYSAVFVGAVYYSRAQERWKGNLREAVDAAISKEESN